MMRKKFCFIPCVFPILFLIFSCERPLTPEKILENSKHKYLTSAHISYFSELHWKNPLLLEVDTFFQELQFQKHPNPHWDYNYIGMSTKGGLLYINGVFSEINHIDSTLRVYTEDELEIQSDLISENMYTNFSPLTFLLKGNFVYKQDSLVANRLLKNYFFISMDTVIDDYKVLLENHVFIDPENYEIPLMMTKHYLNGKENQIIAAWFKHIAFENDTKYLQYTAPENYLSTTTADKELISLIKQRSKAPEFKLEDLQGNPVQLNDFKGKKVLLNFSMINCGWCKHALDNFNKPDFKFKEEVIPLYINPVDRRERMLKYVEINTIDFPVMTGAKEVGKAYGVTGYPTFILIDEEGYVEKTFVGFQDEMVDHIKFK